MSIDYLERMYLSQYSVDTLGMNIYIAGVAGDPDSNTVVATLFNEDEMATVWAARPATRNDVGNYSVQLNSSDTQQPGRYSLTWNYAISSNPELYVGHLLVGPANPNYDNLAPDLKDMVDRVWVRFADLFDSPDGGPNMMTYFQTHFGRGRIAQLLNIAVARLNTISQPFMTYTLATFPLNDWGSLLESACYIESLRHLVRSYVEQPNLVGGGSVTRLDRRDYFDRWQAVLKEEEAVFKGQLDTFKIRNMGFGRPRVLASGGVYGRYGPTRFAGSVAARPRYWTRFY